MNDHVSGLTHGDISSGVGVDIRRTNDQLPFVGTDGSSGFDAIGVGSSCAKA
jgi:hypothetical protein